MAHAREVEVLIPTLATFPMAVMVTDCKGVVLWANNRLSDLTGYAIEQLIGQSAGAHLLQIADHPVLDNLRDVVASSEPRKGESAGSTKNAGQFHLEYTITPIRDGSNTVSHALWTLNDITGHQLAAEKLEELQEVVSTAQLAAHFGVFRWSAKTNKALWSPETFYLLGLDPKITKPSFDAWIQAIHPEDRGRILDQTQRMLDGPDSRLNIEFRSTDGLKWFAGTGQLYRDSDGNPDHLVGINIDITERKAMEDALRKSEAKFSKAFQSSPAAITIADLSTGLYLEVNRTFENITGYRRDEVVGRPWDEIGLWVDNSVRDEAVRRLRTDGSVDNLEFSFRKRNGEVGRGLISAELIELDGNPCAITATIDITEHLHLENQLRQAQRLEGMGRLAGGMAHDFNNLLTVITGYGQFLLQSLAPADPLRPNVEEIAKAAGHAACLTKQLLAFSRKQFVEPRILDLNELLRDSERLIQRLIGEEIALATRLEPRLGKVKADPEQIHQVMINLVINARDAMTDEGKLEISTSNIDIAANAPVGHPGARPGQYVAMTVSDSGSGMDEQTRQRIFEPFFTTKERGKGTGLGLSTAYGIVRQSGGWIDVSSEVGAGASFTVYLPRADGSAELEASRINSTSQGGKETILVVDDEAAVRHFLVAALKSCGFQILEASGGEDALTVAKQFSGEIHLLLTDVTMPGMRGDELSRQLKALRPGLKVLFVSGYSADLMSERGSLGENETFLAKPFTSHSVAAKVREALHDQPHR